MLNKYNIELLTENEDCKRKVNENTLFFQPHLDHYLCGNLINANLESLKFVNIIGNEIQDTYKNIIDKKGFKIESKPIKIQEKDEFYEGFNHTSLITFH